MTAPWGCTDCERIREGFIAQPVNTATSLAFVAAGVTVAARHRHSGRQVEVLAYSIALALVGVGSVAFHGPQPRGSQQLHDWPIAALAALSIGTPAIQRLRGQAALPGLRPGRAIALAGLTLAAGLSYAGGRSSAPTCRPDSPLQLHALWHVLAASGFARVADLMFASSEVR